MDLYNKSRAVGETAIIPEFINLKNGFVDSPIREINQRVSDKYAEKMIDEAENLKKSGLSSVQIIA